MISLPKEREAERTTIFFCEQKRSGASEEEPEEEIMAKLKKYKN